jgi:hypothetical protein
MAIFFVQLNDELISIEQELETAETSYQQRKAATVADVALAMAGGSPELHETVTISATVRDRYTFESGQILEGDAICQLPGQALQLHLSEVQLLEQPGEKLFRYSCQALLVATA